MPGIRKLAIRLMHYCTEHHIQYSNSATYPNTWSAATKQDKRTSNGMLYHLPRVGEWQKKRLAEGWMDDPDMRAYLLWQGESFECVIEALAYLKMTTRRHLMLLNCVRRRQLKLQRQHGLLP